MILEKISEDKMTNKELFTKIYKDNIKREGAIGLLEYIN